MKRVIFLIVVAVAAFATPRVEAQKVIKDAAGNVFLDVSDMLPSAYTTSSLTTVTHVNDAGNTLYKKLQLAKKDLPRMTWAAAVGIDTKYDTQSAKGQTLGAKNTGCKAYSAEGNVGSWRVPTIRELQLIWILKEAVVMAGADNLTTYTWSSTESSDASSWNSSTSSWWLNYSNAVSGFDLNKNSTGYCVTRCVREIR